MMVRMHLQLNICLRGVPLSPLLKLRLLSILEKALKGNHSRKFGTKRINEYQVRIHMHMA